MEFLEFLLQKEGDRSWLPLDSPEAEILEGRYRVMARCDRGGAPVSVRITYLDLETVPPRRRVHHVTRTTTDKGLLAVMPFTPLKTGTWTIRCAAPGKEHETPSWHYTLQLQVLEENAHHEADFEPDFDPNVVHETSSLADPEAHLVPDEPPAPATSTSATSTTPPETEPDVESEAKAEALLESLLAELNPDEGESASAEVNPETDKDTLLQELWSSEAHDEDKQEPENSPRKVSDQVLDLEVSDADETISRETVVSEPPIEQEAPLPQKLDLSHPDPQIKEEETVTQANTPSSTKQRPPNQPNGTSVPSEWKSLPPEMQQDMAQMFQAVDEMAADILASMSQQFDSIFSSSAIAPPSDVDEPESPSPVSAADPLPPEQPPVTRSESSISPQSQTESLHSEHQRSNNQRSHSSFESSTPPETVQSPAPSTVPPVETRPPQPAARIPRVELRLSQDAFSVEQGSPLTVNGEIFATPSELGQNDSQAQPTASSVDVFLAVQLTDPQTGNVQSKAQQTLTLSTTKNTSMPFDVTLTLPPTVQTHLLLGEAVLSLDDHKENTAAELHQEESTEHSPLTLTLTSYAFVVTLELNSLIGAIAQPSDSQPSINPPLNFIEPSEEPALPTPTEQLPPRPLRVSDKPSLPPQIYETATDQSEGDRPTLDLPSFVKSDAAIAPGLLSLAGLSHLAADPSGSNDSGFQSSEVQSQESIDSAATLDSDPSPVQPESTQSQFAQPELQGSVEASSGKAFDEVDSDTEQDNSSEIFSPETASFDAEKPDPAFSIADTTQTADDDDGNETFNPFADALQELEALPEIANSEHNPLENRASDRLISNEQTDESIHELSAESSEEPFQPNFDEVESSASPAVPPPTTSPPATPHTFAIAQNDATAEPPEAVESMPPRQTPMQTDIDNEVVLESSDSGDRPTQPNAPTINFGTREPQAEPVVPPEQETVITIPVPQIHLAEDELIAGQPARISVILPELPIQVFVKLWVQDRQTRSLLDGPRWVADFVADGAGNAEARTHFTVPLGCLEVRIEAIAVDVLSQRESHKTGIDRSVVPPDLPALSLDEFE